MALQIKIPSTEFTNATLPKLQADPVLPAAGALLLVDAGNHPLGNWAAGVPANGATVPNLAAAQALAAIGTAVPTVAVGTSFSNALGGNTTANGFAERTPKGGLHVAFTQRAETEIDSGRGFAIPFPSVVREFIRTNNHSFFVSLWARLTRASAAGSNQRNWVSSLSRQLSATGTVAYGMSTDVASYGWGTGYSTMGVMQDPAALNTPGFYRKVYAGTGPISPSPWDNSEGYIFNVGSTGTTNSYQSARRNAGSWVFYRYYLEDLTVSGRDWVTVNTLDAAGYARDVTATTGRFYGDTVPTSPTTVA